MFVPHFPFSVRQHIGSPPVFLMSVFLVRLLATSVSHSVCIAFHAFMIADKGAVNVAAVGGNIELSDK